ncbi:MAG TPA: hypothetical protein VJB09_01125 [Candidatus Paceibacterota bacterium]
MALEFSEQNKDQKYYDDLANQLKGLYSDSDSIPVTVKQVVDFLEAGQAQKAKNKATWDADKLLLDPKFDEIKDITKKI